MASTLPLELLLYLLCPLGLPLCPPTPPGFCSDLPRPLQLAPCPHHFSWIPPHLWLLALSWMRRQGRRNLPAHFHFCSLGLSQPRDQQQWLVGSLCLTAPLGKCLQPQVSGELQARGVWSWLAGPVWGSRGFCTWPGLARGHDPNLCQWRAWSRPAGTGESDQGGCGAPIQGSRGQRGFNIGRQGLVGLMQAQ